MRKKYWWRITVLFLGGVILGWGYLAVYESELGLCRANSNVCLFNYNSYVDPLMFLSLSILIISPFLFFVNDNIFLKWLRFALVWLGLAIIFITLAPVYTGGWMSFGPTKESVSIWMGALFVILSLAQLVWCWRNES